jgi:hypothetical protein
MADDYPAVRFMAHRSLQRIAGYGDVQYHAEMPFEQRHQVSDQITSHWEASLNPGARPELLISQAGKLDRDKVSRILEQRNHAPISLEE